jgi:hypothetical protein
LTFLELTGLSLRSGNNGDECGAGVGGGAGHQFSRAVQNAVPGDPAGVPHRPPAPPHAPPLRHAQDVPLAQTPPPGCRHQFLPFGDSQRCVRTLDSTTRAWC